VPYKLHEVYVNINARLLQIAISGNAAVYSYVVTALNGVRVYDKVSTTGGVYLRSKAGRHT